MEFKSIQGKLVTNSMTVLAPAFLAVMSVVIWMNVNISREHRDGMVGNIRNSLLAKGKILVSNNAQALEDMVADNAFSSVANLVSATVRDDEDMVYGTFMDLHRQPWVQAHSGNPGGSVPGKVVLDDSGSIWAAGLNRAAFRSSTWNGEEVYEFAAPVVLDGHPAGFIRYGLSTRSMRDAMVKASHAARSGLLQTVGVFIFLGSLALFLSFLITRRQAERITKPIGDLKDAAATIAGGDYRIEIEVDGNDEIAVLAGSFETMRQTVRRYTEHLEELVAEKTQEMKDILDNIEQGLFTVNFDGTINADYAPSANRILQVPDIARSSPNELFRMSKVQWRDWLDWLQLVKERHSGMRWEKLLRLSPVRELELDEELDGGTRATRFIQVDYQRMFDSQKRMSKIMVLIQDITEARRIEGILREEKQKHENEVKNILGIVNHSGDLEEFFKDVGYRLQNIQNVPSVLPPHSAAAVFRDLHTIKGNAASYGFEALAVLSHRAEDALQSFHPDTDEPGGKPHSELEGLIEGMLTALTDLRLLAGRLLGSAESASSRIPRKRIHRLRRLCDRVENHCQRRGDGSLGLLIRSCRQIDHLSLAKLSSKYASLVSRAGEKLGKQVEFKVIPGELELPPDVFAGVDEALIHILRNAVDHGIESLEERQAMGKSSPGCIELSCLFSQDGFEVKIRDDGRGIDSDRLVAKAISLGHVAAGKAQSLSLQEKMRLIFTPGLSTKESADQLSGRGVGMDIVAELIRRKAYRIELDSRRGEWTSVSIFMPTPKY